MERICELEYCEKTASRGRKLCRRHRAQAERREPFRPLEDRPSLEERLWAKVDKTETCWLWTGSLKSSGYGQINIDRIPRVAHRISYELTNGAIPEGLEIDHICHERRCVNPGHLRAVTRKQNAEHRSGPQRNNTSGVLGVSWTGKKWYASVQHHGHVYYVGLYDDIDEAEAAVIAKRLQFFTHNDRDRRAA
jgi:hypothetical protein